MKVFQKIAEIKESELQAINMSGWYIRQVISVKETAPSSTPPFFSEKIYHVLLEAKLGE